MNRDTLQRFPNQDIENRPDECVGETWADIIGNIVNQPCDAGYSYAAALRCSNSIPTTAGSVPYSGGVGGLVYGAIATESEPFDANTTSELYEANIEAYPATDRVLALRFAQSGLQSLYTWNDICNYLMEEKAGVQMAVKWYSSFNTPNADGTLPAPSGTFTYHCVAVYEDTLTGLRIKPWLGPSYGTGGYAFMSQTTFNLVFQNAAAFDLQAWRWGQLALTGAFRPYLLNDIIPQLKGQTPTFS
jgi:hypothetical protein